MFTEKLSGLTSSGSGWKKKRILTFELLLFMSGETHLYGWRKELKVRPPSSWAGTRFVPGRGWNSDELPGRSCDLYLWSLSAGRQATRVLRGGLREEEKSTFGYYMQNLSTSNILKEQSSANPARTDLWPYFVSWNRRWVQRLDCISPGCLERLMLF